MMRILGRRRRAFTLVELLIVMSIMIVLATIAVLVVPDVLDRSRTAEGADRLQEWLLVAKQRAMRDKAPRGLRLIPDPANPLIVRELEYVEVPDAYSPNGRLIVARSQDDTTSECELSGEDITPFVFPNDWLVLTERDTIYRIIEIGVEPGRFRVTPRVREASLVSFAAFRDGFRFVRRPKPLMGEDILQLPAGVVVRLGGRSVGLPGDPTAIDVIFSETGPLVLNTSGKVILWVEGEQEDGSFLSDLNDFGNSQLLTVYAQTGSIASHPVNPDPLNLYSFTQDGASSGL